MLTAGFGSLGRKLPEATLAGNRRHCVWLGITSNLVNVSLRTMFINFLVVDIARLAHLLTGEHSTNDSSCNPFEARRKPQTVL